MVAQQFGGQVHHAYLVYTRSDNHLQPVPIEPNYLAKVKTAIAQIAHITSQCLWPAPVQNKNKCKACNYQNLCTQQASC